MHEGSTRTRRRQIAPPSIAAAWHVEVLEGPDKGAVFLLDGARPPRVLVGTSPACDVRLSDPLVSRRHLALDLGGPLLRVADQGSTNGTFLHGARVVEVLLRGGERLAVGETVLEVRAADGGAAHPASRSIQFGRLLGASEEMRRLHPTLTKLAATTVPVVLEGETGTGKELVAEALHEMSPRAHKPFVVFDCSSVSAALLESELFGHEKGAFTGALATRHGIFEEADGGTLLIDEIGELALGLQTKLLRVLERSELKRVGGSRAIRVDVRVIASTRKDLDAEVEAGRFRDDLFFRLAVGRIELPPLRRRRGDLPLLLDHFWRMLGGDPTMLTPEVIERYEAHSWPGNVRELSNAVARHIALGESDLAARNDAARPGKGGPAAPSTPPFDAVLTEAYAMPFPLAKARVLAEFERRYVEELVRHHGSVARAAAASGLARRYFQLLRARHAKQ